MDKTLNKYYTLWISVALILVTLSVFWQVRHHKFISFDDNMYIYNNSQVKAGLTREGFVWAFTTTHAYNWHPLTWMSHMLDCEIYGLDAGNHHFTNVLFHIANAVLLLLVLNRMTGSLWSSAFVAAAFALHPLHVESVAWASERKDVLSTFFWMLTMLAYVRYVEHPEVKRYLVILLVFALGLMAKQMLVTLPFVLLLLDYWPLRRLKFEEQSSCNSARKTVFVSARQCILEKLPLLILSAVASVVVYLIQHVAGVVKSTTDYPLTGRIINAFVAYITYIGKMLWPSHLAIFYPHTGKDLSPLQGAGAVLLLLCITAAVLWKLRQRPYLAVGWLWYLGTLVPVIGLVQIGLQALADRYTYVPLTGLFIIIAWGTPDILSRLRYRKAVLSLSAALLLSIFGVMAWCQVRHWRNGMTLYRHATEVVPNNSWSHYYLGEELVLQGRFDEAIGHFKQSLQLDPDCAATKHSLGNALLQQGKLDEAIKIYEEFLPKLPDNIGAVESPDAGLGKQGKLWEVVKVYTRAHVDFGIALSRQGKLDEAIKHYTEALRVRPDFAAAHRNLANAFLQQGKLDKAIKHYTEANDPYPYNQLGIALGQQGKLEEAIEYFKEALRIKPDFAEAHTNLGYALARQGKLEEAIKHYTEAVRLDPTLTKAYYDLARALDEQGRISEAITAAEKALELAQSSNQKKLAERIRKHLRLYKDKAGKPYIEPSPK